MLNGKFVGRAGNHEVDAGGDEGLCYNVGLSATTLACNEEFTNRCEEDTRELARNSIHIDAGDLPRVGR